jgi:propanol-preferring alcohol dehydrogenase
MKCYCVVDFKSALKLVEHPTPTPTGKEVLVEVRAAGVCHSDIHFWEGGYDLGNGRTLSLKDRGIKLPMTMGHETAGTAVSMGPEAKGITLGKNYLVYPWIGCGKCPACVEDHLDNHCAAPQYLGVHRDGGYADHILVPDAKYLLDIGDLDPAEIAPYACSGITTYSALNKVGAKTFQKHPVVIMGAGGLGLMCLALVKAQGGAGAIVVDIDPAKRQAALDAGALAAIDGAAPDAAQQIIKANGGKLVQAVIDLVGAPSTTGLAFDVLIKGGKLVIVGLFGGAAPWPIAFIPMKALQILGSYTGSLQEMRELMELVKTGKITPIPVHKHPLADADKVLTSLREGKVTGRAVLTA